MNDVCFACHREAEEGSLLAYSRTEPIFAAAERVFEFESVPLVYLALD
jgi:hypothetical protein